jgi:hypothetical protein
MDVLILIVPFVLPAAAGWYLTNLLCRSVSLRWYWVIVGTAGAGILTAALVWLGLSLGPGDLGKGMRPRDAALLVLVIACGCALIPALMTFLHYRFYSPRRSRSSNVL